jgi:hypothetical protein
MENEKKERIILNDEELKEVVGGKESEPGLIKEVKRKCRPYLARKACVANAVCAWINNQCLPNPNRFEYEY